MLNWFVVYSSCESLFTRQVFFLEMHSRSYAGEQLGCANRGFLFMRHGWGTGGNQRWESVLVNVSWFTGLNCYSNMSFVLHSLMVVYKLPGQSPLTSNHRVNADSFLCTKKRLYLEKSFSHWPWPGLNTTARHCAQSWRMAQPLWQTFPYLLLSVS